MRGSGVDDLAMGALDGYWGFFVGRFKLII